MILYGMQAPVAVRVLLAQTAIQLYLYLSPLNMRGDRRDAARRAGRSASAETW